MLCNLPGIQTAGFILDWLLPYVWNMNSKYRQDQTAAKQLLHLDIALIVSGSGGGV